MKMTFKEALQSMAGAYQELVKNGVPQKDVKYLIYIIIVVMIIIFIGSVLALF